MSRTRILATASVALAIASFVACSDPASTGISAAAAGLDRAGFDQAGAHRQYGAPQKIGNGTVRTYIVLDQKHAGRPLEVGVAMSEKALEGLPAPVTSTDPMANMHMYILALPAQNQTQYKFVQFDWNPAGHEPEGVYTFPHFDFHFYTVPVEVKNSILPSDPQFATKAANYPAPEYRYPFYL